MVNGVEQKQAKRDRTEQAPYDVVPDRHPVEEPPNKYRGLSKRLLTEKRDRPPILSLRGGFFGQVPFIYQPQVHG